MCWFTIPLHCGDAFLGGIAGSKCSWTWVLFGIRERLNCTISYMLAWYSWWLGDNGGLWRLGWTRCMLVTSFGGWVWNFCHNNIEQIDTCFPYLMWLGIFLLVMWIFDACDWWYWWTLCWCVVTAVSSVLPPVSLDLVSWRTWGSFLFGACGPWLLPLIVAGAC